MKKTTRQERRRLEREAAKKTGRQQQKITYAHPRKRLSIGKVFAVLVAVLLTGLITAAVTDSKSESPKLEVPSASSHLTNVKQQTIVQVFLGSSGEKPEIVEVAKSTADWREGKMNPAETELWVSPSQQFWVSNRNAQVRAADLRIGDRLLQQDGTYKVCAGVLMRPIISDEDFVTKYQKICGEDTSVPLGEPGMHVSRVTETFEREVDELYQIYYGAARLPEDLGPLILSSAELEAMSRQVNSDSGGSVFVTGEHPYYVLGKRRFVPVKELEPGDRFRDFKGAEFAYHGHRIIRSASGDPFTVYNIEVANQHTYFAGTDSIWVHNLCSEVVERYTSIFLNHRNTDSIDDALRKTLEVAVFDDRIATLDASMVARSLLLREGRSPLFDLLSVTPGTGFNLTVPSAADGRSFITYVFKNADDQVVYVGRASGQGNPTQVLSGRISRGHEHFNGQLTAEVADIQKTRAANQGAEEFFVQAYREVGAPLTNVDESLSFANVERTTKSLIKLDAFFEELLARQ